MTIKTKRKISAILGILIVFALVFVVDAINGDPISRAWANSRAIKFAQKLYPQQTFVVTESYGGQWFNYGATVQSQQSKDTHFAVNTIGWFYTTDFGQHEIMVEQRYSTMYRQGEEAAIECEKTLAKSLQEFEFAPVYGKGLKCEIDLGYTNENGIGDEKYAEFFALDSPFAKSIFNTVPSRFVAQILCTETPKADDVTAALQRLKAAMEQNGINITYYEIALIPKESASHEDLLNRIAESGLVAAVDIPG